MKKQFIIKELNTNLYWSGFFLDDEWSKDVTKANQYDAEWKAKDTIQSALFEQMSITVEQPMFEIVTVYLEN
jgi:hypothetical protein